MIDWQFIGILEGNRLVGYVPRDFDGQPLGKSGVTVAAGVDLGQRSTADILALKLPPALVAKLMPYTEVTGAVAMQRLTAAPLVLMPAEAQTLNAAVRAGSVAELRSLYNGVVLLVDLPGFDDIPGAAQTILASVSFQYGDLEVRCPCFWRFACAQSWPDVAAELRAFADKYPTRRKAEADYLEAALSSAAA